jgi:hypothetical protein
MISSTEQVRQFVKRAACTRRSRIGFGLRSFVIVLTLAARIVIWFAHTVFAATIF